MSAAEPAASETHRFDVILPNGCVFSFPTLPSLTGRDLVTYVKERFPDPFVITQGPIAPPAQPEVLYCSAPEPKIYQMIKLSGPFMNAQLAPLFMPNRLVQTRFQRMAFYVFRVSEFWDAVQIQKLPFVGSPPRTGARLKIQVRLPTGLVISCSISPGSRIRKVERKIYSKMAKLYGTLKDRSGYRLGTIKREFPDRTATFDSDRAFVAALRRQRLNKATPQFVYEERLAVSQFDRAVVEYARALDLSVVTEEAETLSFNASMSRARNEVEIERAKAFEKDPLIARMRLSDVDPPLATYLAQVDKSDPRTCTIAMKVDLGQTGIMGDTGSSLSIRVPYDASADYAIEQLLMKITKLRTGGERKDQTEGDEKGGEETVPMDKNPKDYVLLLMGMDEVLSGDTPLFHFVCVRQQLLSSMKILNLMLSEKKTIIEDIKRREMNKKSITPEPGPESLVHELKVETQPPLSSALMSAYPHSQATEHFCVFIKAIIDLPLQKKPAKYVLGIVLVNGCQVIGNEVRTKVASGITTVLFNQLVTIEVPICDIPRSARIAFTLYDADSVNSKKDKGRRALATYNFSIFRFDGWMNTGNFVKKMWHGRAMDLLLTTCESNEPNPIQIIFNFPSFTYPLAYLPKEINDDQEEAKTSPAEITEDEDKRLKELALCDQLHPISSEDKELLWRHRHKISQVPALLPLVLLAVDYSQPVQVQEVPRLLACWAKPSPTDALSLLDAKYADPVVRDYAVSLLDEFRDHELMLYLLQMVQALKYELYDDSPLARFLVRRGLREPKFLGHQLFWQLMSEAHISHIRQRFSAMVVNFMYGIGIYRDELLKGYKFTQQLVELNQKVLKLDYAQATTYLREALRSIDIPKEFHLPMDPRLIVDEFIFDQCKVMNSKKKPFWLTFRNASPFATEPVRTMFKVGDDLRQDQLTLQVMKVMEYLWRENGRDFHMRCYGVLPTGWNQGFIEVVPNAVTESELQKEKGGWSGVSSTNIITKFLAKYNTEKALLHAREVFRLSSAGYAIATSVLGVADRHPGNIMIQQDGHFFHIDYGHFLGNWKEKLGWKREGDLFHFSPACAEVIGEKEEFRQFEDDCWAALSVLRKNSKLLITLFLLMLGTGIPELRTPADIVFLEKKLVVDANEEQQIAELRELIKKSKDCTRTKLNNLIHNMAT